MRPTEFGLKAPSGKTPNAIDCLVNYKGNSIKLGQSCSSFSFSKQPRFTNYSFDEAKLGFRIGPGTYNTNQRDISNARVKNSIVYRNLTAGSVHPVEGLYFSGNLLVYEDSLVKRRKFRKVGNKNKTKHTAFGGSTRANSKSVINSRTRNN